MKFFLGLAEFATTHWRRQGGDDVGEGVAEKPDDEDGYVNGWAFELFRGIASSRFAPAGFFPDRLTPIRKKI